MSQETFAENRQAIRAGLAAVISNPKSRRIWRLLPIYEEDSGELLGEVFPTAHGPVIWHYSAGRFLSRSRHHGTPFTRRSSGSVIVAPLTGDPDQRFLIFGHNCRYVVQANDLRRSIAQGEKSHSVSPAVSDDHSGAQPC